jgi:signal transduction histidine kinase/CheY-like chemotaxis protein
LPGGDKLWARLSTELAPIMMGTLTTNLALFAGVAILSAAVALYFIRAARGQQVLAEKEKERLLDEIWELKATASALNKAEAANEAKSRFLAMVSHEVRTPLTGILGMAELLTATDLTAEQQTYVDAIRLSGESLSSLINEILDFSKIEAGKLDLNRAAFDLQALIEGIAELLAPRAQGKGIEIATSIDRAIPHRVLGDSERLRQVLMNLAGNAVKFTEMGGVGIVIRQEQGGKVHFSVCDTGPGVPEDRRQSIFEEFEQVDGSMTRRHEGTGLGLAISKLLVELMGGDLQLERSGPEGSVFCFSIALPPAEISAQIQEPPSGLNGKTALIVADSPFGGPFLAERLAELGAKVFRVGDEAEALRLLREKMPDLVIVDCALGEQAAHRVVVEARKSGAKSNLVLFSPFERRAFGEALVKDCDGWLVKPVRLQTLHARLGSTRAPFSVARDASLRNGIAQPLAGRKILLAEDNDINALLIERHLSRLGAQTVRARDGAEAVSLVCANFGEFDAVLMDIRMPRLDGFSAARQIRAVEKKPASDRIRMIALTANAAEEDRLAAEAAGMDGFLTKPVDLNELARAIGPQGVPPLARRAL